MYQTSDIKKGLKFKMDGAPWNVIEFLFVKPGKGTAFTRTKLRNLVTGQIIERNFRTGETFEEVDVENRAVTYMYNDGDHYYFLDSESFEQHPVLESALGDATKWLQDNMPCDILFYEGRPISIDLPNYVELEITYCEPAVKGDTANNATKQATVSTGATVLVPLFVENGTTIKIDTRTGEYCGRIGK